MIRGFQIPSWICAGLLCLFLSTHCLAYEIDSDSDAALSGASLIDFSSVTFGSYPTFTTQDVDFLAIGGSGYWTVSQDYSGQYGMTGTHLDNAHGNTPGLRVDFPSTVSAFGFQFGAHDQEGWTLVSYLSDGTVTETRLVPTASDNGYIGFYGLAANTDYFIITGPSGDYILFDDLYFVSGSALTFNLAPNTPNQAAILEHLEGQIATASGEFSQGLSALAVLPDGLFQRALDELSPEPYVGLRDASLRIARSGSSTVTDRLLGLQQYHTAGIQPNQLFASGNSVMTDAPSPLASPATNDFGIWVKPYMYVADQNKQDSYFGYTQDYIGLSVGADYRIADNFILGVVGGYASGTVDYKTVDAESDIDTKYIGIYGSALLDKFYMHAQAGWYMHTFDMYRHIETASLDAESEHNANEIVAILGCDYQGFHPGGWSIIPGASIEYSRYDEESFDESNAGAFSLEGDSIEDDAFATKLALRVNKSFDLNGGTFIPEFRAAWRHDFSDTDRDVTARFSGSTGDSFTVEGVEPERDSFELGASAHFVGENMAVSLNFDNEIANDFWGWGVSACLRYSF